MSTYCRATLIAAQPLWSSWDEVTRELASAERIAAGRVPLIDTSGKAYLRGVRKVDVSEGEDVMSRADSIDWHSSAYFNGPEYPPRGDARHPLRGRKLGFIVAIATDPITAEGNQPEYTAPVLTKIGKAKAARLAERALRLTAICAACAV